MEGLQTLPSNQEGTSNHLLQLPHFVDEEAEGSSGDVASRRCPAGSQQLCHSRPRPSSPHQAVQAHHHYSAVAPGTK